jgi:GAF domain-containing protein
LAAGLNVYAPVAGAFSDQHRQAAVEFAAYAAVALTNMNALQDARDQAEHLRAAMGSRATIEQAKGILMERHRVNLDQAFRLLAGVSMRTNRRVRDLAEHLVLTGELGLDHPSPGTNSGRWPAPASRPGRTPPPR